MRLIAAFGLAMILYAGIELFVGVTDWWIWLIPATCVLAYCGWNDVEDDYDDQ